MDCSVFVSSRMKVYSLSLMLLVEISNVQLLSNKLPSFEGSLSISGTRLDSLIFSIAFCYGSYWLTIVILAGADRLPASSTAMTVKVFSPAWVAYKMARSPPVVWSRTPFMYTSYTSEA